MRTSRSWRAALPGLARYVPRSAGSYSSSRPLAEGARGGGGTAGDSCRKWLVEPPTPIGSTADGTQLAGSFPLVAAKSPPLGGKPRRPEFELAGVRGVIPAPLRDPVSSQWQACPWRCPHWSARTEIVKIWTSLQGKVSTERGPGAALGGDRAVRRQGLAEGILFAARGLRVPPP